MKLLSIKADFCMGYSNVELTIENDDYSLCYIHYSYADDTPYITISTDSIWDVVVEHLNEDIKGDTLEVYESVKDAKNSLYYPFIKESEHIFNTLGSKLLK